MPDDTASDRVTEALSAESDVRLAYAFGSTVAGTARRDSDLDVAVLTDHPLDATRRAELIDVLAEAAARPIDLIDLQTAGVMALRSVLGQGRRLICRDRRAHERLVTRLLVDTEDFLPYRERMLRQRREAWIR
jgi:predicted nucleotidyltransferase